MSCRYQSEDERGKLRRPEAGKQSTKDVTTTTAQFRGFPLDRGCHGSMTDDVCQFAAREM